MIATKTATDDGTARAVDSAFARPAAPNQRSDRRYECPGQRVCENGRREAAIPLLECSEPSPLPCKTRGSSAVTVANSLWSASVWAARTLAQGRLLPAWPLRQHSCSVVLSSGAGRPPPSRRGSGGAEARPSRFLESSQPAAGALQSSDNLSRLPSPASALLLAVWANLVSDLTAALSWPPLGGLAALRIAAALWLWCDQRDK